jgi:branched-chain amino acid transport system ATP-binding protein
VNAAAPQPTGEDPAIDPQNRANGSAALTVSSLTAGYGALTILRDLEVQLHPGELTLLAGANGAGKTTFLSALMGTLERCEGEVSLGSQRLTGLPPHRRTQLGLGIVPEGRGLFGALTVQENLRVAVKAARLRRHAADQGIERAIDAFPVIGDRLAQKVGSLSGGEQQMVAFGRALLTDPQVLLLDEPSMGLAPVVWKQVLATCRRLADEGRLVLLVEQRVAEALEPADRCIVLNHGRVVRDAPAETLGLEDLAESYFTSLETAHEATGATT